MSEQLQESAETKTRAIQTCTEPLQRAADLILGSIRNRGKLILCGNGGSAADAQHLAAEMVVQLSHNFKRPGLPAIALTTDSSILTAGGNDIGFDQIFARQLEALGQPEDILLVITTSGNSKNIINALAMAREKNIKSIGFLGGDGGQCVKDVTISVTVPSKNTQRIQETHITLGHILIELVERDLHDKK
ncbi:MAG: SIS domain-containing protein [Calditrichales bacterium]|nr:MAG: SIS domain-containing protein [Calditrichales bacterium]